MSSGAKGTGHSRRSGYSASHAADDHEHRVGSLPAVPSLFRLTPPTSATCGRSLHGSGLGEGGKLESCRDLFSKPGVGSAGWVVPSLCGLGPFPAAQYGKVAVEQMIFVSGSELCGAGRFLGEVIGDERGIDVPGDGGRLAGEMADVCVKNWPDRRVALSGHAHAACAGHGFEQATGVVDYLIVGIDGGDRLVDVRGCGYLAREVSVEEVAVACPAH
jgi:hypothetical protein